MLQKSSITDKGKTYYLRTTTYSHWNVEEVVKTEKEKGRKVKIKTFQKKAGEGVLILPAWAIYSTK